jgi:hypothetical protein
MKKITGKLLCFLGIHHWSIWINHAAYGDRQSRYCRRDCGHGWQERRI